MLLFHRLSFLHDNPLDLINLIIDFYDIKHDPKYAYEHVIGNQHSFTYSQQFIDFIITEIGKNPTDFVESLKKSKK